MSNVLPADSYPFEHSAVTTAGIDNPLEIAYSHATVTVDAASLSSPAYVYEVRARLGVRCPVCGESTVEPAERSYSGATVAAHVNCTTCDWRGTAGDIEREQFNSFTEYTNETIYQLWEAFGTVTNFAGASRGALKRECRQIAEIRDPVREREAIARRLPEPLTPTPPTVASRFVVDDEAVEKGVNAVLEATPYNRERVTTFVEESYAIQSLQPTEAEVIMAQTGLGRVAGAFARRPLTATDEERIEEGYNEVRDAITSYVNRLSFATEREAVMAVRAGFEPSVQRRIRSDIIADVIGCNQSYAAEFELVTIDPFPIVLKKEHVARREMNALTATMRETVKERDDYTCLRCGGTENLEVHHIIPVAQGGVTNLSNLGALCEECHKAAHGGSYGPTVVYESQDAFWSWVQS